MKMFSSWSFVEQCGAIGVLCAAWNLLGDLYFMDFFTVHMKPDEFGAIADQSQSGYLFFDEESFGWAFVAQSGGWMYPVWAFVTAVPIYIGLQESGDSSKREQFWWSMFPLI